MWAIVVFAAFESFLLPNPFQHTNYNFPNVLGEKDRRFDFGVGRRFGLAGLDRQDLSARWDNFLFRLYHVGQTPYQEYLLGLGGAYPLMSYAALGIGIDGMLSQTRDYSSEALWTVNAGSIFQVQKVRLSFLAKNVNGPRSEPGDSVPLLLDLLIDLQATEKIALFVEGQTLVPVEPMFNAGTSIELNRYLGLILGVKTEPLDFVYGVTLRLGQLDIGYCGDIHDELGVSHRLNVGFILR